MTILGIALLALGAWTNLDNHDHQLSQLVNGMLVMAIGALLIVADQTTWLAWLL